MDKKKKYTVEVIEYNPLTNERFVTKFEEYHQAIGFIKNRRREVKKGVVLLLCDIKSLTNIGGENK